MPRRLPKASPPADFDLNPRREPVLDFPVRGFGEMTPEDWAAIGFICGLEVHQQLLTRGKLFCRCSAGRRTKRVDAEVLRHMRPTLSEMGLYDGTALMEFKTRKEIVYRLERESVCTYEIDDTPPFPIDEQAVRQALEISRLFDLQLVSELQVMRKQYLDGSIPTGFQRTAMVGIGGEIPFRESELGPGRVLRIRQLTLEEDSCREVSDVGHRIVFRTDRLGMPLIETVTEPDLLTPRDVMTGGRLLARVVRSSGKVRRGAGAARQDVNVSVAGGRRVEIKGVCQHRILPRIVHVEAFRQLQLLRLREELVRRGVDAGTFASPDHLDAWDGPLAIDARSILRGTGFLPLSDALARGEMVCAVRLPQLAGLLGHPTQPGFTFVDEIAERVRVIACLTGAPFLLGSDGDDAALGGAAWRELRAALGAGDRDAIVVVWGVAEDVETAAREVLIRAADATVGVPSETRQPLPDGTTGFERILPGPERMYPDTDTPPLPIPDAWVSELRLAERPWHREDRYREAGLSAAAAARLVDGREAELFDALAPRTPASARRLASALEKRVVHWRRECPNAAAPAAERLAPLVRAVEDERIRLEAFEAAFDRLLREPAEPASILCDYTRGDDDTARLDEAVARTRASRRELPWQPSDASALLRWAMGQVMPAMLGRISPATVRERLTHALEVSP